jgi:hypothetical protein
MPEPRKPGLAEKLAAVASTLVITWFMMPAQERYWIKLKALALLHQVSGRHARRAGHLGMGDELAGRDFARYRVAYRLSLARDAAGSALERLRP